MSTAADTMKMSRRREQPRLHISSCRPMARRRYLSSVANCKPLHGRPFELRAPGPPTENRVADGGGRMREERLAPRMMEAGQIEEPVMV